MSKLYETREAVSLEQDTPVQSSKINTLAFVGLQLSLATSRSSHVNIDQELKDAVRCILMHVHFYWAVCHQRHGQ